MFQGSLKGVLRMILGCFKEVSRVFQKSLKGVSRKIERCFNFVLACISSQLPEQKEGLLLDKFPLEIINYDIMC